MMRILVIDDEEIALQRMSRIIKEITKKVEIKLLKGSDNALKTIDEWQPDLVFLDIEMPNIDGISLAMNMGKCTLPPAIIFVTAHPEHALSAYTAGPADYVLKPVSRERLEQAINNAEKISKLQQPKVGEVTTRSLSFKTGNRLQRLKLASIIYLIAEDKYVRVVFDEGEILTDQSLLQLENDLGDGFIRIHRKCLVNTRYMKALHTLKGGQHKLEIVNRDEWLDVSRRLTSRVSQLI
jgi:two-component system response regulator AlgR